MTARHSVRVGYSITAQSLAKIFRFADVKDHITGIAHEIDPRALWQLAEEVAPEPLDERLRIGKEKLLSRRHGDDLTRNDREVSRKIKRVPRCFRWNDLAGKLQTPSSKLQRSSKPQTSSAPP